MFCLYLFSGEKPTCLLLHKPCIDYMNHGIDIIEQSLIMLGIEWVQRTTQMNIFIAVAVINNITQMKTNKAA